MARSSFHATGGAGSKRVVPQKRPTDRAWFTASRNSCRIPSIPGTPVVWFPGGGAGVAGTPTSDPPPPQEESSARKTARREIVPRFMRLPPPPGTHRVTSFIGRKGRRLQGKLAPPFHLKDSLHSADN